MPKEIWAKKKKKIGLRTYTQREILEGEWGHFQLEDMIKILKETEPTEIDDGKIYCDWCGRDRHDGDCETDS